MKLTEVFSQARMEKCLGVYQLIVNNWIKKNQFQCKVVADESLEGKSLEELGKVYFDVGVGGQLTSFPFIDTLVVFSLLRDKHRLLASGQVPKHGENEQLKVKTAFSEDEAFELLNEIVTVVGVTISSVPPT
jgi:hypothetical protein